MKKLIPLLTLLFSINAYAFKVGGMTWVTTDGSTGQAMTTDGHANLGWSTFTAPGFFSATSPLVYSGGNFSIPAANSTTSGYLVTGDWVNFNNRITGLSSDVSATGPTGGTGPSIVAATVNSVGGSTAANVHAAELAANAASSSDTSGSTIVKRSSGNFSAGTITASLTGNVAGNLVGNVTGNVSGSAGSFTGLLAGDVTGTQSATAIAAGTVTGKLLTGYVSGAGTVASTDSILAGIQKLNGNDLLKAPLSSPTFTGTITGPYTTAGPIITSSGGVLSSEATLAKVRGGTGQDNSSLTFPSTGTVQATTPNNHGVLLSGTGATATVIAPDASTSKVLVSGGASADPSWSLITNSSLSGSAAISNANLAAMAAGTFKGNVTAGSAVPTDVASTGSGNVVLSAGPTLTGTIGAASETLSGTLGVTGVATFTAAPILSSTTASQALFTDASKNVVSNAITGSGNVVMSADPTLTGTIAAANETLSGTLGVTGVATFTAAPILSSTTASQALFTDASKNIVSNAISGSGSVAMTTSPVFTTPNLGTPSAAVLTNASGTAASLTAGNVSTNHNMTGPITGTGNVTSITAQTGTGTTFVMSAGPTITGTLAAANETLSGTLGVSAPGRFSQEQIGVGSTIATDISGAGLSYEVVKNVDAANTTFSGGIMGRFTRTITNSQTDTVSANNPNAAVYGLENFIVPTGKTLTTSGLSYSNFFAQATGAPSGTLALHDYALFNATDAAGTATGTNKYAYYTNGITGATNNYGFFDGGSAFNTFSGSTRIGSTTNATKTLDVTGTLGVSGASTLSGVVGVGMTPVNALDVTGTAQFNRTSSATQYTQLTESVGGNFVTSVSGNGATKPIIIQDLVAAAGTEDGNIQIQFQTGVLGGTIDTPVTFDGLTRAAIFNGPIETQRADNSTTTATQNALSTSAGSYVKLTGSATITINCIDNVADGKRVVIENRTGNALTLADNATGSCTGTAKAIRNTGSASLTVGVNGAIEVIYDAGSSLWASIAK